MKRAISSAAKANGASFARYGIGICLAMLCAVVAWPHPGHAEDKVAKIQVDCTPGKKTATVPPGTTHVWWMNDRCFCTSFEDVLKREVTAQLSSKAPIKIMDMPSTRFNDSDTSTGRFYCYTFETIEKLRAELNQGR